jgi:hypothetical protein
VSAQTEIAVQEFTVALLDPHNLLDPGRKA